MNGVSDQERQSVMSSAESQSSQWTRGRRLMVSLPIFIILLGILVSVSNLTASSWKYEPTGQTIETLSSDTAVTFDNPSGKTLAKRGDYEVTQRYVTIEAKQPSTGEIQQVKVLIREPKDAGNNRPGVVFMHGAGYGTCDNSFGDMATDLSSAGFVTAVLDKPVWSTNDVLFEGTTFGGQITSSPNVENYPGIASVSGSEFSMNLMDQAVKLGTQTMMEQVTGIREEADYKVIVTTEKEYECKSIILATGVTHRHLGVPGEERLTGAGVSYCATCDGMFFRGREVAVVGGGSTALQDAEFLSNYCSKVYLIHRRDEFRGEDQIVKRLQEKENVEFILNTTVQEIRGEQMVESLRLLNKVTGEESELAVSGIFVAVGQIAQNEKFADVVQLDEGGFIVAGEDCKTSEAGIYAAGDCRTKEVRQLTTAAADGAVAALAACKYIADVVEK